MDFKIIEESDDKKRAYFHLKSDVKTANLIRRIILNELPAFAINEVEFYDNTSPMFNEYVAHRLGLIPLTFDEEVDSKAEIALTMDIEAISEPIMVYAKDIKSADEKIKVFDGNIPIIKLAQGQKVRFEGKAVMGLPRIHAKFHSALAAYSAFPEVSIEGCKNKAEILEAAPEGVFDKSFNILKPHKVSLDMNCFDVCEPEGSAKIVPKENEFVFFVESYNNLTAKEQVRRAIKIVEAKFGEIQEAAEKL
jgi:DNA-directed RNA polymerase subunit D